MGGVEARRIRLRGHVQGVGFRPFVYRLAQDHGVAGHVQNQLGEVEIVAVGSPAVLDRFVADVFDRAPPLSSPALIDVAVIDVNPTDQFAIVDSSAGTGAEIFVPPDYFMCDDCRGELQDPADRRFGYPFINCTQCGPRYTLIEALPYDRPNTSMSDFPLCPECEAEYTDPGNRRFHAEPVACARCGPRLIFERPDDETVDDSEAALTSAVNAVRQGKVVAVKGIGGYHLICDARNDAAVRRLRERKCRPAKPLAVMFPVAGEDGLDFVRRFVDLDDSEASLAASPMRPIVLARRRPDGDLAPAVAPGLQEIGIFLPYSPLHQLLLDAIDGPVVATSGNISGEPVLTDNDEATRRLAGIADAFLQHNRPIVRPADDPVYRRIGGCMRPIRVGRGCAPKELTLPWQQSRPTLAVGGHMKGTVALSWGRRVIVSPHIGEMDSPRSLDVFAQVAEDHASAVAAEFDRPGDWLVFAWDGVGLGRDGSLWGGEAFLGRPGAWRRFSSLRPFRLPGGDKAGREPWRSAAALLWECGHDWPSAPDPDGLARAAWQRGINCPESSAAGRLFDGAAALVCDMPVASFEAQGPMALEALCGKEAEPLGLPLIRGEDGILRSDWQALLEVLRNAGIDPTRRAEIFHASMAGAIRDQALAARQRGNVAQVGLGGGVFQNRVLAEQATRLLEGEGFDVYLPQTLPCNDAALSFGQAAESAAREARE